MNYYKLINKFNDKDTARIKTLNKVDFKDEYLYKNEDLSAQDLNHLILSLGSNDSLRFRDFMLTDIALEVFSNRLISSLKVSGLNSCNFIEIKSDTEINNLTPYWYPIIKHIKGSLNIDKSDATHITAENNKGTYSFIRPVIYENKIKNLDIFRISEAPQGIYVSENFRQFFEENKFNGAEFLAIMTC